MLQPGQKYAGSGKTLIALGSNVASWIGDARETIENATIALAEGPIQRLESSRLYRTPAFPPGAGPDYVNAVVSGESALTPDDLLAALHEIEARFGRERHKRWASRTLDLDLLAMGETVLPDPAGARRWMQLEPARQMREAPAGLVLPHPRMQDRAFVLVPAADVAPDWRHPLTGRSIAEMLAALPEAARAEAVALD